MHNHEQNQPETRDRTHPTHLKSTPHKSRSTIRSLLRWILDITQRCTNQVMGTLQATACAMPADTPCVTSLMAEQWPTTISHPCNMAQHPSSWYACNDSAARKKAQSRIEFTVVVQQLCGSPVHHRGLMYPGPQSNVCTTVVPPVTSVS